MQSKLISVHKWEFIEYVTNIYVEHPQKINEIMFIMYDYNHIQHF